ncbi:hypothetical protein PAECIP111891_01867 [Paenibacillus allorhizoplanae]|uniref:PH domain-containing protein n=1 Tax=Paenibacillus allorhizoplanae TaxID=2905648 RepID=A0ABN8G7G5_9BACL|nr:hypothetical protein PAECIP111891_01867 [Paenibacillus allorhizoplanae]
MEIVQLFLWILPYLKQKPEIICTSYRYLYLFDDSHEIRCIFSSFCVRGLILSVAVLDSVGGAGGVTVVYGDRSVVKIVRIYHLKQKNRLGGFRNQWLMKISDLEQIHYALRATFGRKSQSLVNSTKI